MSTDLPRTMLAIRWPLPASPLGGKRLHVGGPFLDQEFLVAPGAPMDRVVKLLGFRGHLIDIPLRG
jgi:hypothetical protein